MQLERERWIVMRNNRTEILCGASHNRKFRPVDKFLKGNWNIATFQTEKQAKHNTEVNYWKHIGELETECEAIKIKEIIKE